MIIDIPVFISFDCSSVDYKGHNRKLTRVFTLRMDIDDTDAPVKYTTSYPPKDNNLWLTDHDGVLVELIAGYDEIVKQARLDPQSYCADPKEGERLQAEMEAARDTIPVYQTAAE